MDKKKARSVSAIALCLELRPTGQGRPEGGRFLKVQTAIRHLRVIKRVKCTAHLGCQVSAGHLRVIYTSGNLPATGPES